MRRLVLIPDGWPLPLIDAPPGPGITLPIESGYLIFKSEYCRKNGKMDAYNEAGEFLCIDETELVQPLTWGWENET